MAWNPVRPGLGNPQQQASRNVSHTGLVVIVPSFREREALLPRNRESVLSAGDWYLLVLVSASTQLRHTDSVLVSFLLPVM